MPSVPIIQTLCSGSYATTGSLTRAHVPGGVAWTVVPGRPPLIHVRPPSVDVAKPTLLPPPLLKRPTW